MKENKTKPDIRFKGFTEAWEQRKLGDNIVEYTKKTTVNNQYPVLTSSRRGIFFQTDYYDGNQIASIDNTGYNIVPYGYFTYRHMSDDEIFHFNINDITENGIVSTLYPVFTTDKNLNSKYLQYQLNYGKEFAKYAILQKQGGSRTYMYLNKLKELYLTIPNSIEEQKKISTYFMEIDNLITLHQRECDQLKELKKSMLKKMFPRDGSSIPEVRFAGFTDAWEQRKLNEIVERVTRKNKNNESSLALTISAQFGLIDQNIFFDKRIASKDVSNYYLIKKGEFAYNKSTSNDAPWGAIKRLDRYESGVLSTLYILFKIKNTNYINSDFLSTYYSTNIWHKDINSIASEGARNHGLLNITADDFFKTTLFVPKKLKEQQQIGQYFSSLDNLITLHQRELEILKNLKKTCLKRMFI
ncbi:restriction endonuclease subunit S [Coprobacillus sp. AF35-8]|nr:restriction endonuclease subunit S [Coprobacillus sp. AF35-8]